MVTELFHFFFFLFCCCCPRVVVVVVSCIYRYELLVMTTKKYGAHISKNRKATLWLCDNQKKLSVISVVMTLLKKLKMELLVTVMAMMTTLVMVMTILLLVVVWWQ